MECLQIHPRTLVKLVMINSMIGRRGCLHTSHRYRIAPAHDQRSKEMKITRKVEGWVSLPTPYRPEFSNVKETSVHHGHTKIIIAHDSHHSGLLPLRRIQFCPATTIIAMTVAYATRLVPFKACAVNTQLIELEVEEGVPWCRT